MTIRKTTLAGALALAATAVAAPSAMAEPDHKTAPLGGSTLTATWEGTGSGIFATQDVMDAAGCQPAVHDCFDALIEVTEAGSLTVKTSGGSTPADDTDLQLFTADANGEVKDELQESAQATPTPEEQVSARVKPGFYVARIDYAICAQCTIQAEAALKPSTIAAPAPAPSSDAPPTVTARKPRSKRVRSFKGTASTDAVKVEIGILKLRGSSCQDVAASGRTVAHEGECTQPNVFFEATGTTSWTAKLSRRLKKGSYVLFARATDAAGQTQGGYGKANRKAFKVKR